MLADKGRPEILYPVGTYHPSPAGSHRGAGASQTIGMQQCGFLHPAQILYVVYMAISIDGLRGNDEIVSINLH